MKTRMRMEETTEQGGCWGGGQRMEGRGGVKCRQVTGAKEKVFWNHQGTIDLLPLYRPKLRPHEGTTTK
jgi:hypothetical protein